MPASRQLRNGPCRQLLWQPSGVQGRRHASLQVRSSMNYGAEWSESPESYIVLVRVLQAGPAAPNHPAEEVQLGSFDAHGVHCICMCLPPQGLAHCFRKDDNGKLMDHFVIEPISANSLEVRPHPCAHALVKHPHGSPAAALTRLACACNQPSPFWDGVCLRLTHIIRKA